VGPYVRDSESQRVFRSYLFMRIVPILKDIGLWGPRIVKAFTDMGVLGFADGDLDAEMANDETAAEDLDKLRMDHITRWPPRLERCTVTPGSGSGARAKPARLASP